MNGWLDGWVDAWVNDIKTCPEVRESDIINVNNCLPNPYVYDIPKNDFIPQHIISLQMNVIFQEYFCLWRLLLKVIWKYYFKFNCRIILKLYNNTVSILHYFMGSSKEIKPNVFTKVLPNSVDKNWLNRTSESQMAHMPSEELCLLRWIPKSMLPFLNDNSKNSKEFLEFVCCFQGDCFEGVKLFFV